MVGIKMDILTNNLNEDVDHCTCVRYNEGSERVAHTKIEPHICPFRLEIDDDYETLCECCSFCEYQCAMDI